jgi:Asp-tRNA(Asn)/Glu-tRNA(Gln) amidotransferase A subunit family amidase
MTIRSNIEKILANAEDLNPKLNSFLSIEHDNALSRADALDSSTDEMPLKGLPIAIKDVL